MISRFSNPIKHLPRNIRVFSSIPKDPNAPSRGDGNPYVLYVKSQPGPSKGTFGSEHMTKMAAQWRALTAHQKQLYIDQAEAGKK